MAVCQICKKDIGNVSYPDHTMHMACLLAVTEHVRRKDSLHRACQMALQRRRQAYMRRLMLQALQK